MEGHTELTESSTHHYNLLQVKGTGQKSAKGRHRVWEGSKCKASLVHMMYYSPSIYM